ncbi:hypothetical protein D0863_01156 [Hortaea werneckii]|uniref:HAUS augmin-like complex subunit 3 N-terminal domain-containing protein n=1 Tax=Hortaea werneckii TaxID=91943 RepID=A0A3M7EM05_HORWE|nr:hypothetical protein D0863_01156 [Hortaea werneckii]
MASKELHQLLRVLEDRNVDLGRDDVEWAFESASTKEDGRKWVQDYLSPECLLSKEEFKFFNSRGVERSSDGTVTGRPLTDLELENAITSLESSTAAIEKQCQLLESQKVALQELKSRHSPSTATDQAQSQRQKKCAREKAQLEFEVNELADGLQSELKSAAKQAETSVGSLPNLMERILEKDDRVLDGLQKLIPRITQSSASSSNNEIEVDELCRKLSYLTMQEIRDRIDSAYRSATASTNGSQVNGHSADTANKISDLQAELDELTGEIEGLATMAVDGKYRHPILRELKSSQSDAEAESSRWNDYVLGTLQYLTTRAQTLDDHATHLHSHQGAINTVARTLEGVAKVEENARERQRIQKRESISSPSTPIARGLKPLRLVQANFTEPQDAISHLLRQLDVRSAPDLNDTEKLSRMLGEALKEREGSLRELEGDTELGFATQLAETLAKADANVSELLGAVYKHSPFGSVNLVEGNIEEGLGRLEGRTQELGEEMRRIDIDHVVAQARKAQASFLQA